MPHASIKMLRNRLQNKKFKISESIIKFSINILYLISETNPLIPDLDKIEITLEALSSDYYNVISIINNETLNDLEINLKKVKYLKLVGSSMKLKQKPEIKKKCSFLE